MLQMKRIYDTPEATDGLRVLVDRLWPRGMSKASAAVDVWLKDIAPSSELRTWFGHRPDRFTAFAQRYEAELQQSPAIAQLQQLLDEHERVTLVYAAKEPVINHVVVLRQYMQQK